MKYENKKTGAILDSPSPISGGDWIEYGAKPEADDVSVETKETKDEVEKDKVKKIELHRNMLY